MLKKILSIFLSVLLLSVSMLAQSLQTVSDKEKAKIEKIKQRVVDWGTNKNVTAKFRAGGKQKGRVSEISDEFFTLQFVEQGRVSSREIRYEELKGISGQGDGANIAAGIAVGALAAVGVVATVVLIAIYNH
jgi:Flp pilus assembly protein TadB